MLGRTAHHGHKIDGRERVLTKNTIEENFRGARGVKILCFSSIVVLAFLIASISSVWAQAPVYSTRNSLTAQMEVRLQQMEEQIRGLTGRVEKQIYEINQLKQQVKTLEMSQTTGSTLPANPGAGQIAVPETEKGTGTGTGQGHNLSYDLSGKSIMAPPAQKNPLNLAFKPPVIAGMKTAVPGGGTTDATALYEQAYANLKVKKYQEAQEEFEKFLTEHKEHVLAANAKYWLGETYYVRGEYKKAARIFAEGFQAYPKSAKAPDILLKLGMSLNGLGKKKDACVALSQVSVKFPTGSEPVLARAAQEMEKLGCES